MRTWFITGVGSGLGHELARQVLAKGDQVAGTVRDPAAITGLAGDFPERLWTAELDLSDLDAIPGVIAQAFARFGTIDIVVNNAGYGLFGVTEGLTTDQVRHQIDTNLLGPVELTRAALPHLRAQGGGQLIAISSYGGQATHAGAALYHASKWGLEGFFESLAQEVASFGIRVTIVEPGAARTGFRNAAGGKLGAEVAAYSNTALGRLREFLANPQAQPAGDPARMAAAIVAASEADTGPLRLVLGSDAQAILDRTLSARLTEVRSQAQRSAGTDAVDEIQP